MISFGTFAPKACQELVDYTRGDNYMKIDLNV